MAELMTESAAIGVVIGVVDRAGVSPRPRRTERS
jgi:hypothetical protein